MLYFIPAWYQNGSFSEIEQYWYARRLHTEFDDTVKQVQLFHRSGAYPYRIMLLSFAPNFRHFLHRQGVFHAPYWSCFDAMQEIKRKKAVVLSYHNIEWPKGVEFTYSPFALIAFLDGRMYARVEFGEDGNPIEIDMYKNDKLHRRNIYDDRGFVSSTVLFDEDEKPFYQDYLNDKGVWKLRYFYSNGHVRINEKEPNYLISYEENEVSFAYSKTEYESMDDVMAEVLEKYLAYTAKEDIFCAACHDKHANILGRLFQNRNLILSFFENRYIPSDVNKAFSLFKTANRFVVDSEINTARIENISKDFSGRITDITPYDSRVDFGISQQLEVQNIVVPVDGLNETVLVSLIKIFDEYVDHNKNARVHFFTRSADDTYIRRIYALIDENVSEGVATEDDTGRDMEKEIGLDARYENPKKKLFFVEQCVSELEVSKCMREQRVMVDLRDVPELFLQISAISGGIPQIVKTKTQYVFQGQNGYIIDDLSELSEALDYYLINLNNWNEAKIFSYELGKKYTTKVLLNKWKEVIESIG